MSKNDLFTSNGEFNTNFPSALHHAAGTDDLRPALQHIVFTNGNAYVSDAHILVRQSLKFINIEGYENLEGKKIHRQIFRRIYNEKQVYVVAHPDCIEVQYLLFNTSVKYSYSTDDNKPPNYEAVIPDVTNEKNLTIPDYAAIGINHRIFARLISAMKIDAYLSQIKILLPPTNNKSIIIVDQHYDNCSAHDQLGLIMPVMISNP
jgi:hypothetical protein